MKINGKPVPDWFTHEAAADFFMSTAVGKSTGASRDEVLRRSHERFPTEAELNAWIQDRLIRIESALTPPDGPYTLFNHGHAIRCNTCMKISWNSKDVLHHVLHRWCGHCHHFHDLPNDQRMP